MPRLNNPNLLTSLNNMTEEEIIQTFYMELAKHYYTTTLPEHADVEPWDNLNKEEQAREAVILLEIIDMIGKIIRKEELAHIDKLSFFIKMILKGKILVSDNKNPRSH